MPFLSFTLALIATMALLPPLMRSARHWQAMDLPGARKVHSVPIPRVGGLAMVCGTLLPALLWGPIARPYLAWLAGVAVIVVFGLLDDRYDLNYKWKFLGQMLAAVLFVAYGGVLFERITFGALDQLPYALAVPVTVLFVVAVTNAINLSDGLDGLAGGIALMTLAAIGKFAYDAGQTMMLLSVLAVMGAILGFLRYNTYPAQVFMGDTGSQFLGFTLAAMSLILTQQAYSALSPMLPLLLLGLPLIDMALVMFWRLREGRSPFAADRNHLHHRLLALGLGHYQAVSVIYVLSALLLIAALLLRYESDLTILTVYLAFGGGILGLVLLAQGKGWQLRSHGPAEPVRAVTPSTGLRRLGSAPYRILGIALPALLLLAAGVGRAPTTDVAVLCLGLGAISLFTNRWLRQGLWLRMPVYVAGALAVYLLQLAKPDWPLLDDPIDALFVLLGVTVALAIRYASARVFTFTPLDLLVVLLAVGVWLLQHLGYEHPATGLMVVKAIILFYASEFVLSRMRSRWHPLPWAATATLLVTGVRGLI